MQRLYTLGWGLKLLPTLTTALIQQALY